MCPFPSKSTCKSVRIYQLIFRLTEKKLTDLILSERGTKHILENLVIFSTVQKKCTWCCCCKWHDIIKQLWQTGTPYKLQKKNLAQCHFVAKSLRYFVLVDCWITWFLTKMTTVFTQNGTGEKSCHFKWQEWIYSACNSSKQILCLR